MTPYYVCNCPPERHNPKAWANYGCKDTDFFALMQENGDFFAIFTLEAGIIFKEKSSTILGNESTFLGRKKTFFGKIDNLFRKVILRKRTFGWNTPNFIQLAVVPTLYGTTL